MKKKIFIVCDSSKSLLDFRGRLIEKMQQNNRVYIFTPKIKQAEISQKLRELGVTVYQSNLDGSNVNLLSDLRFIVRLFVLLYKIKPDIFFPYTFKPVVYGVFLAKLLGVGLMAPMLTGLGYNFVGNNENGKLVRMLTKILLKQSLRPAKNMRLILQNPDDVKHLTNLGIINQKHQVFVVNGSGIDLTHYCYAPPLPQEKISFLMMSRLINAKGINEYYQAAKLIKSKYPQVEFKLVGSRDKNIDGLNNGLYKQLLTGNVVLYQGELNDVRPAIACSSVVVLPSYREGVPRSILEAMAMGRPIITCDSAGCRETVNPVMGQENGFLVPVKDAEALADRMEYFILHPDKILAYGLKSLAYATSKFDVNIINNQLFKIMSLSA